MRYHKFPRLYVLDSLKTGLEVIISKQQSHYLVSVMRRKLSEKVILFNGKDGEFLSEITEANKNAVILKITNQTKLFKKCPDIQLFYCPVKNAKNEFIVQKATELGVSLIQPIICERSVKTKINKDKLKLVAMEASEQCERLEVPMVNDLMNFGDAVETLKDHIIIFCDETGQGDTSYQALSKLERDKKYAIFIGPEGGFSDSEIEKIYSLENKCAIGLGPRILRADTAIITALSLVQNYVGDFNLLPDFRA